MSQDGYNFVLPATVNIHTAAEVVAGLDEILQGEFENLNLDGSGVTRVDTAGLQLLISAYKTTLRDKKGFAVVNPSQELKEILELSGAVNVLPVKEGEY